MRPLLTLSVRWGFLATGLVFFAGLAAGGIRLLPWLLAPFVALSLSWPFARLLLSSSVEVAVLVGVPVGFAIGAAIFVERGEHRALSALGMPPRRLIASLLGPLFLVVAALIASSFTVASDAPGRFSARLIAAGRASCDRGVASGFRSDVPLLGLTWLCLRSAPRIVGQVPGFGASAWFSAGSLAPDDELRSVSLRELHLTARLAGHPTTVSAAEARVDGLPGWGAGRKLSGPPRALVVGVGASVMALFAVWLVLVGGAPPLVSAALSGLGSAAAVITFHRLDSVSARSLLFVLLPLVGILTQSLVFFALSALRRGRFARREAE